MKARLRRFWYYYGKTALLVLLAAGMFVVGGVLLWASTLPAPSIELIEKKRLSESTKLYDRTGDVLLFDLHQEVKRSIVGLEEMSPYVRNATIVVEDAGFYHHFGIEPLAIVRAVITNLREGDLLGGQGGSTITQQVVKNALLVNEKTISRKVKEWVLALKVERSLSKDDILEMYLNTVPYGGNHYGVEEASQAFYGKPAKDLTPAEAAYLAALPQRPTYFSPYGQNRAHLDQRKNYILERMYEFGYLSGEAYENALAEAVVFRPQEQAGIKAPHFVFYVLEQVEELYGGRSLEDLGLRIYTTLDWELQRDAEAMVTKRAKENEATFNASNASLVAIDTADGAVRVMVGSRDYFDEAVDGAYNIATARRQPGSSFKPFVYAAALERGFTPETVVFDLPTQFSTACSPADRSNEFPCYAPTNYDDAYRGPITFRNALAQSVNVPAVKVLYLVGMDRALAVARSLGITTLGPAKQYGLSLVLGGGEVSLLEMTSAYSTFAREGVRHSHHAIARIENAQGEVLYSHEDRPEQVLSTEVARQITDMLSDNTARTPAFGADSYLHFPGRDVAVKTGTTNEYRDAWIIGYTPGLAVGAWAGNSDNTPMAKKVAGFIIAPLWNDFMQRAFEEEGTTGFFTRPNPIDYASLKPVLRGMWQGSSTYMRDSVSGRRATDDTPEVLRQEVVVPSVHSILHWVDPDNPRGPVPTNPGRDPQYALWEYPVRAWAGSQGLYDGSAPSLGQEDNVHTDTNKPRVRILSPEAGERVEDDGRLSVRISVDHLFPIKTVTYLVDGEEISRAFALPDAVPLSPDEHNLRRGMHSLVVRVVDEVLNEGEAQVYFEVR